MASASAADAQTGGSAGAGNTKSTAGAVERHGVISFPEETLPDGDSSRANETAALTRTACSA